MLHRQAGETAIRNLTPFVDAFWSFYVDLARDAALADGLPFDRRIPVYYERLTRSDGTPGDRVGALHTHWLTDAQREQWITAMHSTQRFYAVSVESMVNLLIYFKRGEEMYRRGRSEKMRTSRGNIALKLTKGILHGPMYTEYTPMAGVPNAQMVLDDIAFKLARKHEPATGEPGTQLGTSVLLQVDTRYGKDNKFRSAHPYPKRKRRRSGKAPKRQR